MYNLRFFVLDNFSKNQKSSLLNFLKCFVKKYQTLDIETIWQNFIEEIEYRTAMQDNSFSWMKEFLCDEKFEKDVKNVIREKIKYFQYKELQKPFYEKQKAEAKIARRRATEWRQSHEKPTKRQLSYYSSLCFKYKEEKVDLKDKSKLDLKNLISEILKKFEKKDEL